MPFSELIRGDSDCCELVWDNGQVIMRNQSSRERKGSSSSNNLQDGKEAKNSKAKFGSIDNVLNDFPLSAPPCDMSLDEDDNSVPWLSCPVVTEPFNNVYCPDILPESFGVNGNEFSHSNATVKPSRLGNGETSTGIKLQKNNAGTMNFSYFSRFASHSGVNMRNNATNAAADGNENKDHMESTFVNSSVGFSQQESGSNAQRSIPPSNPPKSDSIPPEQSVAICRERDGKSKLVVDGEKAVEPAVATSSVCSGNSLERDSNNPASNLKRKCLETGDSEGPSEEVEDESVGVRKTATNRFGSKRSRASVVHNQSERRRRERINEKMRALQELIPSCNKVDKASMLDEAIEYLKTLQLQVQILSMGSGMYMSQMMLPAAMQHMHRAHIPQFSPMGIGMGAALGFGMNMPDFNSMMQMPSIQGPCFPVSGPPISNSSGFYGTLNPSHQGLGNLGQGLSVSTPHAPLQLLGGIPMRLPMGNVSGMPLANISMNQGPNQETMVLNQSHASNVGEAQNTR